MDRGNYYSGCQARDSSSGEGGTARPRGHLAVERQDTDLWRKQPGVERQDPAKQWKHHVSLPWRVQGVRTVHKVLPVGICRRSVWSQACPPMVTSQDVRVARRHCRSFLSRTVQHVTFVGVDSRLCLVVRYAATGGQQPNVDGRNCNRCDLPGQMRSDAVQQDPYVHSR